MSRDVLVPSYKLPLPVLGPTDALVPSDIMRLPVPVKFPVKTLAESHLPKNQPIKQIDNCFESFDMRLASFFDVKHPWPCEALISPKELSAAGFFYTGQRDCVQCFACLGKMYNFDEGDSAFKEHQRHFPRCKFVKYKTKHALAVKRHAQES